MKTEVPFVSVIVPIYNVLEFLPQCIQSLADQSLQNIEFLLINDGSTDGSGQLASDLVQGDKRFTVYDKENGGLSDARNFGIERANGDFIGFVDSDDWVEPTMFQKLYDKAIEAQSDIVVCAGVKFIDSTEETIPIRIRGGSKVFGTSISERPEILYAGHSLACNKLLARRLFDNPELRFPVGQWFEDSAVIYNIMATAARIDCVPEQLYQYRFQREGSITSSVSEKIFDIFASCNSILEFYRRYNLLDGNTHKVLEKIIRNHIIVRFDVVLDSADKDIAYRYTEAAFDFMDETFPGWVSRYPMQRSKLWSWKFHSRRSRILAKARIATPTALRVSVGKALKLARGVARRIKKAPRTIRVNRENAQNRALLQSYGYHVLGKVGEAIQSTGVVHFADFGTLLGFTREGGFMAHDVDIDIGVLSESRSDLAAIRKKLFAMGCSLWREYVLDDLVVEESYYFPLPNKKKLKFDINYYRSNDTHSRTWLFYLAPKQRYAPRERSIVEMEYSRIDGVKEVVIEGHSISIPLDPERLLFEKYGPNWQIPDTGWIYWQSPAAKKLNRREFYRQSHPNAIPEDKLRDLQLEQLEVLDAVSALCEKHGLRYYLSEGTLLGAIRHQGYIPWDDDIDIAMPRNDYDRLMAIPASEWPSAARLWWHTTDPKYHLPFAKAVATAPSNFRNTFPKDLDKRFSGPRIDIFPLDRVPFSSGPQLTQHWARVRLLRNLLMIKSGYPVKLPLRKKWRRTAAKIIPNKTIHAWLYRQSTKFNGGLTSTQIINNGSSYGPSKQQVPAEWYGIPNIIEYEGKLRPCPSEPEKILTKIYKDYMTPPPEEKRINNTHYMRYFPKDATPNDQQ